jgi:aspartate/methionine/tyrosine aminotransferase
VAVVPGGVFGGSFDRHVRISYAVGADELMEGLNRIRAFLA